MHLQSFTNFVACKHWLKIVKIVSLLYQLNFDLYMAILSEFITVKIHVFLSQYKYMIVQKRRSFLECTA